jgi:MerR family redox-sensitive transcriptional activator SoxR
MLLSGVASMHTTASSGLEVKPVAKQASLSIGQLARRTGVAASALRYYEEQGLLPAVPREHGRRCYDSRLQRQVDVLLFARRAGLSLRDLKALLSPVDRSETFGTRWRAVASQRLAQLEQAELALRRERSALLLAMGCACRNAEDCTLSPQRATEAGCCSGTRDG